MIKLFVGFSSQTDLKCFVNLYYQNYKSEIWKDISIVTVKWQILQSFHFATS